MQIPHIVPLNNNWAAPSAEANETASDIWEKWWSIDFEWRVGFIYILLEMGDYHRTFSYFIPCFLLFFFWWPVEVGNWNWDILWIAPSSHDQLAPQDLNSMTIGLVSEFHGPSMISYAFIRWCPLLFPGDFPINFPSYAKFIVIYSRVMEKISQLMLLHCFCDSSCRGLETVHWTVSRNIFRCRHELYTTRYLSLLSFDYITWQSKLWSLLLPALIQPQIQEYFIPGRVMVLYPRW